MDKSHIKMLKKIKKAGIYDFTNASEEEKATIEYLGQQGYMKYYMDEDEDPRTSKKRRCVIREKGKAYLYERREAKIDKWVPYIITTTISVIALMKSYGLGIDDIFTWCMQLLKQSLK